MSPRIILSFLVIYVVWGSTFTAIKWGLEAFPPFTLAGLRFMTAGLVFLILSRGKGINKLSSSELLREVMIGILLTSPMQEFVGLSSIYHQVWPHLL